MPTKTLSTDFIMDKSMPITNFHIEFTMDESMTTYLYIVHKIIGSTKNVGPTWP